MTHSCGSAGRQIQVKQLLFCFPLSSFPPPQGSLLSFAPASKLQCAMGVLVQWWLWNLPLFLLDLLVKALATENFFIPPFVGDKGRLNAVRKDGYIISGRRVSPSWQHLISLWCSHGQLDFQFCKAQVSVLLDKQLKNEDFLGGMEGGTVLRPQCPTLWGMANCPPKNISTDARQASKSCCWFTQSKHRISLIHSLTAEKSFPEAFMEYVPPPGMQVHLETLKQVSRINFGHDALPHFTMWSNLTPCQATGNKVTAQMLGS